MMSLSSFIVVIVGLQLTARFSELPKNTLTRFAFSGCSHFRPTRMSIRICSLKRAKDQVVQRRDDPRIRYSSPADFHAVSIHVHGFVRAADNHGHGTAQRFIWIPITFLDKAKAIIAPGTTLIFTDRPVDPTTQSAPNLQILVAQKDKPAKT